MITIMTYFSSGITDYGGLRNNIEVVNRYMRKGIVIQNHN